VEDERRRKCHRRSKKSLGMVEESDLLARMGNKITSRTKGWIGTSERVYFKSEPNATRGEQRKRKGVSGKKDEKV
jgi:hypothetical protein